MKKALLATTVASLATLGMANAATVYENEGFALDLKGKIGVDLKTTFAHTTNEGTVKQFKDIKGDELKANSDLYSVTNFGAVGSGDLTIAPSFKISDGLKVFGAVKAKFTTHPESYAVNDGKKLLTLKDGVDKEDKAAVADINNYDLTDAKTSIKGSPITLDGVKVGLGGTAIFGKLELGSKYGKGSSIKYTFGPMAGLEAYVGAVLPFEFLDNRPNTLQPKSVGGYDFGLGYELELDKDMTLGVNFDYKSRTDNTKAKNILNKKEYANWQHTIELGAKFEMETISAELGYEMVFVPTMSGKYMNQKVSAKKALEHTISLDLEVGLMEGLALSTGVEVGLLADSNANLKELGLTDDDMFVMVTGDLAKAMNLEKVRKAKETQIDFNIGLEYELASGFTTGLEVATETTMTSLGKDVAGKDNAADTQMATMTVPSLTVSMGYEF